jgi:hypothetical protein
MFCIFVQISEAIACARRCRASPLTRWWTQKEYSEKMEGQGDGEALRVADPKKNLCSNQWHYVNKTFYFHFKFDPG